MPDRRILRVWTDTRLRSGGPPLWITAPSSSAAPASTTSATSTSTCRATSSIVFTGVSGSGKSSLAFDTLYAEGQRRYVESLSSYARQFLGQLQKPDVDYLAGLSPAISIQQKTAGRNPRSTVGTITEIYDYLRVLYARIGQGHCPECGRPITAQTREQILARILALPEGHALPGPRPGRPRPEGRVQGPVRRHAQARLRPRPRRWPGRPPDRRPEARPPHQAQHRDRHRPAEERAEGPAAPGRSGRAGAGPGRRVADHRGRETSERRAKRRATKTGGRDAAADEDILLSAHYACTHCNRSYEPPSPQLFSFNSPHGMCPDCDGLGTRYTFDPDLLIPDPSLSFYDGAIPLVGPLRGMGRWRKHIYEGVAKTLGIDLKTPWNELPARAPRLAAVRHRRPAHHLRVEAARRRRLEARRQVGRHRPAAAEQLQEDRGRAAAHAAGKVHARGPLPDLPGPAPQPPGPGRARRRQDAGRSCAPCRSATSAAWLEPETGRWKRASTPLQRTIAGEVLKEIRGRLGFLLNVGLHYLTLDRTAPTLSGGEAQRIRLAGQIGCGLVGVLYILDEPSIGLHPRDNDRLLRSLERLRDMGNTVLVVEHDEDTMRAADYIVDFGPGPGVRGGEVVAAGTYAEVVANPNSLTGQYLSGTQADRRSRRSAGRRNGKRFTIVGARHNNLKNIDVEIPARPVRRASPASAARARVRSSTTSCMQALLRELRASAAGRRRRRRRGRRRPTAAARRSATTTASSAPSTSTRSSTSTSRRSAARRAPTRRPTSRSSTRSARSSPSCPRRRCAATSRAASASTSPGGRCEACEGNGSNRLEMDFLADVWVTCPVCEGRRFNRETLQVRFKGKSIHDVLEMDVQEALEHFAERAEDPRHAADAARRRPRLHQARPAVPDAVRRRGPAHQAGPRAVPPQHRPDALHPRRADDRPALRRHPQAAASAARLRRRRQHRRRHRAQPRRHQDGRLAHRPRPRRRQRRRRGRLSPARRKTSRRASARTPARRCGRSCNGDSDERREAARRASGKPSDGASDRLRDAHASRERSSTTSRT